ncbi:hypothetical protein GIB67_035450 [Kingdonia uniflora]|uniref:Thionin-like protein 2 n=1 Tax=Kingdonia uniflora TaxID=39325 RepID=A0A7J7P0D4_9MAGN|nr:hypothetical protein GIB67_035450 [Kingdonia uniflora]
MGNKSAVLLLCVMMVISFGMFGMQITASSVQDFTTCYVGCYLLCNFIPRQSTLPCSLQCLKDCIIPTPSAADIKNYCDLGCASSLCSNLSTQQHPNGEKVEACVSSCSETCTKHI